MVWLEIEAGIKAVSEAEPVEDAETAGVGRTLADEVVLAYGGIKIENKLPAVALELSA
jgi:hypothetical protein